MRAGTDIMWLSVHKWRGSLTFLTVEWFSGRHSHRPAPAQHPSRPSQRPSSALAQLLPLPEPQRWDVAPPFPPLAPYQRPEIPTHCYVLYIEMSMCGPAYSVPSPVLCWVTMESQDRRC